jgi:small subunit ribosomal protein S4
LDNVVYRLGFATSRPQGRQLVNHGHFMVNGRKVDIPSYLLQQGDVVELDPNSRHKEYFQQVAGELEHRPLPDWLTRDAMTMSGRVLAVPTRESMDLPMISEQLIVEYYSR